MRSAGLVPTRSCMIARLGRPRQGESTQVLAVRTRTQTQCDVNSATTETGPTVMGVARLAEMRSAAMAGDARLKRATTAIYGQKTDAPRRAPWNSVLLAREALRPL